MILDLLFPKKCVGCGRSGSYLCRVCFSKISYVEKPVCPICQRQAVGGKTHPGCAGRYRLDGLIVPLKYKWPINAAIKKIKYKWIYSIEEILVSFIVRDFWKSDVPDFDLLVPIPLHAKRKRWRGFNQAEIIASDLAGRFKVKLGNQLIRNRETKTQVGLSKDERKKNISGAFSLRFTSTSLSASAQGKLPRYDLRGKNIALVDDVYTTGATMSEACKVLKKAGAGEVWALCAALG